MLTFIGLGLFDKTDVSEKGLHHIRAADRIFLECYTSRLGGTTREELEIYYGKPVTPLFRKDVEQHPDELLDAAQEKDVVFLCAGDPMVSTTHADLRMRAAARGIRTEIVHAASISSAVCGLSGLQNYRFGKSCSLPFPQKNWFPTTPLDVILQNLSLRLHTLVFLDIQEERYMTVPEAVALLEQMASDRQVQIPLYVGIARAGSGEPVVRAGSAEKIRSVDFGHPLHILVIPAELHDME
ncbi:MAG: diphthine synthase, partial [Methanoregula sp.]|nr:diphthine synthase [Methanoregula sp.]